VPAHELFARWETTLVERLLRGGDRQAAESVWARWRALREIFFAPSYTRLLTLLSPVYDRERERIGFYRVVLPRTAWYLQRLKNWQRHPGWSDLPLDLVPELPLAHWALERIFEAGPELATHLRRHGYGVATVDHVSLTKPGRQTPQRAFRKTRVVVALESIVGARLLVEVDLRLEGKRMNRPRVTSVRMNGERDPRLAALALDVENRVNGPAMSQK
jgi:hypothetical protein